jgi:hypothetical protein
MAEHHSYSRGDIEHDDQHVDWPDELQKAVQIHQGDADAAYRSIHHSPHRLGLRRPVLSEKDFASAVDHLRHQRPDHPEWAEALAEFAKKPFPGHVDAQKNRADTPPTRGRRR